MPTTQYKSLSVQTTGSNVGGWGAGLAGISLNEGVISPIDSILGGMATIGLSSTTPVTLTAAQSQQALIRLTGTLLANIVIQAPIQGFFQVENACVGNFSVSISYWTGSVTAGASAIIPYFSSRLLFADATNGVRAIGLPTPGTMQPTAIPTSALHPSLAGEWVLPFGQTLAQAVVPNLYVVLGGSGGVVTLPDLRGKSFFAADNMGGVAANILTTAGSGVNGSVIGSVGGSQSTTLSISNMPTHTHANTLTDPGHAHTTAFGANAGFGINGGATSDRNAASATNPATTGVTITNASAGSGTAFAAVPPAFVCNVMMKT